MQVRHLRRRDISSSGSMPISIQAPNTTVVRGLEGTAADRTFTSGSVRRLDAHHHLRPGTAMMQPVDARPQVSASLASLFHDRLNALIKHDGLETARAKIHAERINPSARRPRSGLLQTRQRALLLLRRATSMLRCSDPDSATLSDGRTFGSINRFFIVTRRPGYQNSRLLGRTCSGWPAPRTRMT